MPIEVVEVRSSDPTLLEDMKFGFSLFSENREGEIVEALCPAQASTLQSEKPTTKGLDITAASISQGKMKLARAKVTRMQGGKSTRKCCRTFVQILTTYFLKRL